eukprot:403344640
MKKLDQKIIKGRLALFKLKFNHRLDKYELSQASKYSDFPDLITSMCPNYRDQNELLVGSGQNLFLFNILKTDFEYSLQCLKFVRVRAQVRCIQWKWSQDQQDLEKGMKSVKSKLEALILLADNEEGLSIFTYNERIKDIKLKSFDISSKALLYAEFLQNNENKLNDQQQSKDKRVGCVDFNGRFYLMNQIQSQNPLLRQNMEAVDQLNLNEMGRKFQQLKKDDSILTMGLRGQLSRIYI